MTFLKDLNNEINEVKNKVNEKIKDTIVAVNDSLFMPKLSGGTPVLTGHLRSNWIVTKDNIYEGVVGSRESVDTSTQIQYFNHFLSSDDLYFVRNIYFNNNVYYGPEVNAKYSFREKAIQNGNEWLQANRKL